MAMTAADLQVKFSADTKGAEAGMQRMSRGISGFAKQAAAVGTGILGAAAFAPIVQGFSGAITGAIGFGKEMANVNSILQTSSGTITKAGDDLLEMALRTAQAPTVLAAGLYQIVSSGYTNLADAEKILEISAKGATAGLTTTDVSARAVVGTMNAYGLGIEDAQRVSDVFFQTVNDGVLTYDQLANNLGKTTALAAGLNVPIEQLGAAYAQMTRNNVDAAQSETQIAALFRSALSPTQALTDAVHAHGYESAEALIKAKGLPGYLELLNETAGGSQTTMQDLVGTQEAANAAMILGQKHGKAYNEILNHMAHASDGAGATQKALNKQMESSAYAIQKARVALQVLATAGFGIVAPLVTKLATGLSSFVIKDLIPFTKIIGRATSANFTFGRGFDKLLKGIPQPLRRTVHAIASFTDALSDMWRHGFSRNELTQAFHAVQALGEEFGQAVHWTVNAIVDAAVSLGTLLIEGVIAAPGAIFDWVRGKLFGKNTGISQDPASPMYNTKGAPVDAGVWDVAVALGKVILSGAAGVIGDIWGWVKGQILGGPGSISQDPASPMYGMQGQQIDAGVIDVLAKVGSIIATKGENLITNLALQISAWTSADHPALASVGIDVNALTPAFAATAKGDFQFAVIQFLTADPINVTPEIQLNIKQAAQNWAAAQTPEGLGNLVTDAQWLALVPALVGNLPAAFGVYMTKNVVPDLAKVFWSALSGAVTGFTQPGGAPPGTGGENRALADPGFLAGFSQSAVTFFNGIGDAFDFAAASFKDTFTPDFDFIGTAIEDALGAIPLPDLPDWLTDFHWITDPIDKLHGYLVQLGLLSAQKDAMEGKAPYQTPNYGNRFNPVESSQPGYTQGGTLVTALPATGTGPPPQQTVMTTFAADTGPLAKAYTDAFSWGETFAKQTFMATFSGDNGPMATAYSDAFSWGTTFAAQDFQATLSADNGPAAVAYTNAFGWGATWAAQTFTARFAIDTSGLWNALAVAQIVAANISAIMPHSPAKKGPLSKPISFGFIADAARRDLAGLGNQISGYLGVGGTRRPLAYAGVHAGPRHITIHVNGAGNPQTSAHVIVKELRAAGF